MKKKIYLQCTLDSVFSLIHACTVGELKDWTKRNLWSKTALNTGGMGGTSVDPPTCKMGTFFLMSLTLTEPSLNNFQSNGGKWPRLKL